MGLNAVNARHHHVVERRRSVFQPVNLKPRHGQALSQLFNIKTGPDPFVEPLMTDFHWNPLAELAQKAQIIVKKEAQVIPGSAAWQSVPRPARMHSPCIPRSLSRSFRARWDAPCRKIGRASCREREWARGV